MNGERFAQKIIELRKKKGMTQQELADQLNVSNKTVSRWETNESYPDIEMLKKLAEIFNVTSDYLLGLQENIRDLNKKELISYTPFGIGIIAVLTYYIFVALSMPAFFAFAIYYVVVRYSYQFLNVYTDKKNGKKLVYLNTATAFIVGQSLIIQTYIQFLQLSITNMDGYMIADIFGTILPLSYFIAAIYAAAHWLTTPNYK